jgi:hypothetical protein
VEVGKQQGTSNATRPPISGHKSRGAVLLELLSDGELVLVDDGLRCCQSKLKEQKKKHDNDDDEGEINS